MGWIIGKGIGIPFRMGSSQSWSSYWTAQGLPEAPVLWIKDFTEIVDGKYVDYSRKNKQVTVATTTIANDSLIMPASDADIIAAVTAAGCYDTFYTDDATPKTVRIADISYNLDGYLFCNNNKYADFFILPNWNNPITTSLTLRNTLKTDSYLLHTSLINGDDAVCFDEVGNSGSWVIDKYSANYPPVGFVSGGTANSVSTWKSLLSKAVITTGAVRFSVNHLSFDHHTVGNYTFFIGLANNETATTIIALDGSDTGKFNIKIYNNGSAVYNTATNICRNSGDFKITFDGSNDIKFYRWINGQWTQLGVTKNSAIAGDKHFFIQSRDYTGQFIATFLSEIFMTAYDFNTLYP